MPIEPGLHLSCHDYSPPVNATLYCQLIGGLIYLAYTKTNIFYYVSYLSRFMHEPKKARWTTTKHVLRCIRDIDNYGLEDKKNNKFILYGYKNVDYGGSLDDIRATIGYVFFLGSGMISWVVRSKASPNLLRVEILNTFEGSYHVL